MNWAIAGLVYAGAYVALMTRLADHNSARLWIGNIALLLPPLAPLAVLVGRRRDWRGRQAVFWGAIGAWAALWLLGQVSWATDELLRSRPLPWFKWHIILQLSGSALPLIALVARPHRPAPDDTAITVALDIAVLGFLTGFLYWSLVIAPGMEPSRTAFALQTLAIIGPAVRLAAVTGLLLTATAAGRNPWSTVYLRLAYGMILAFVVLALLALAASRGDYRTGSPADIGWMLPFWFAAWAAATSPASEAKSRASESWGGRQSSPLLLFVALLTVPIVGYALRYVMPLGDRVDRMRDLATTFTLVCGIALVIVRLRVEHRATATANERVRLLATACEQAGELIVIVCENQIEYANDAFCRASGYSREELKSLPPIALMAPDSSAVVERLRERLRARQVARLTAAIARTDGSTFQAACAESRCRRPGDALRCRHPRHHRGAAPAGAARARRTPVGDWRIRVGGGARNQQPAAVGHRHAGADARPASGPGGARRSRAHPVRGGARGTHRPQPADVHPALSDRAAAHRSERDRQSDRQRTRLRARARRHRDP
jgi:PAS domain S-box-containing protein